MGTSSSKSKSSRARSDSYQLPYNGHRQHQHHQQHFLSPQHLMTSLQKPNGTITATKNNPKKHHHRYHLKAPIDQSTQSMNDITLYGNGGGAFAGSNRQIGGTGAKHRDQRAFRDYGGGGGGGERLSAVRGSRSQLDYCGECVMLGAFTGSSRTGGATKIRVFKDHGGGGGGGEKLSMVRGGGSRSQLDYCSECMVRECSCSSAISRGNEIAFEDNFHYHLPTTREYHVPGEAEDEFEEEEEEYSDDYELFVERTQQQRISSPQQQQPQPPLLPTSVLAGEFIDKRQPRRPEGNNNRLKAEHRQQLVSTNPIYDHQHHIDHPLRAATTEDRIMTSATTNHQNNNLNHKNSTSNSNATACHKISSLERGLAMNEEDRRNQGLLGLLPATVQDQDLQSKAVMNFLENCKDELSKYVYLRHLKDFNEKLFYYTLIRNVEKCMPLVYTPTVGLACQKFSEIYMRPRGLYITAKDHGRVKQILANWPEQDVRVIVVTDGERILGLGDLGANGMGISIGKLSLYTALAGIPPQNVLPITIDVGTNNQMFLKDPFYIGLRQPRVRGEKYEQLIEEFMKAVVERWGRSCLIQFEDFANATAFNLLEKYRDDYCTFNDDIQGTASVCLSGLITAAKLSGKRLRDCSFLFYGAGEANLGTAHLLIMAMKEDGLGEVEAKRHIWLVDSKGLVVSSRTDLTHHKKPFAQDGPAIKDLEEIIGHTKPTAIIGASAQGGAFTESICKKMAQFNEKPIIFALSNPTSKAECTADQAYQWTDGKCVFASGSPFDPVQYKGKTYITGQGNNAYIFPGVGLAAIGAHTHLIPEETFLVAARALSDQVTSEDTSVGLVYPKLSKIREVTLGVATRVLEYFYTERLATYRPEPNDKLEFLKAIQYNATY